MSESSPKPIHSRVCVLIYNPVIESEGGQKLNQVLRWNDPDVLARNYIADVRAASHGLAQYEVADRVELNAYPVKQDGFRYTDASFLRAWRSRSGFHDPDAVNYQAVLHDANFMAKLAAGLVDELWVFAFPYGGFFESCMGGPGAIWCNGTVIPGTRQAAKRFVVMGFNYERGVGEMLEDLGHRAENIMEHIFHDIPDSPPARSHTETTLFGRLFGQKAAGPVELEPPDLMGNLWRQFIRYDKSHPGNAACGNVHFAPSSAADYDWGNTREVVSNADDWLNYPNFTGQTRPMRCGDWGHGDMRAHHIWWMQRFPHVAGKTPTGKPNNWWAPIIDPNQID